MPANDLTVGQIADVANNVFKQAVGITGVGQVNAQNFVTVAQAALLQGTDVVTHQISQVLTRTIFAQRPYYEKLRGLEATREEWGNHVRKISMLEVNGVEENPQYTIKDGESVDMMKVTLPHAWQGNFYGKQTYKKKVTVTSKQFREAFRSLGEFDQFISNIMLQATNQLAHVREGLKRATLANLIASTTRIGKPECVIHLLTEYNDETGKSYTKQDVMSPNVYPAFIQWCFAKIQKVSMYLTDESNMYHLSPTAGTILRQTPRELQRSFLLSGFQSEIDGMAKANTYWKDYMQFAWTEMVNYWQNIRSRDTINILPQYIGADGLPANTETPVQLNNVFGVIMDRDAAGVVITDEWQATTPFNADAGYYNIFWHFTGRWWNDNTENCVVFLLD